MFLEIALAVLEALRESRRGASPPRVADTPRAERVWYRTRDGEAVYAFSIDRRPDGCHRVHIVRQPPYGSRSTDPSSPWRNAAARAAATC